MSVECECGDDAVDPAASMRIVAIYLSPGHNYFGHYGMPPGEHPVVSVREADCLAGQGLCGDRFFGFKEDYKGQITFFAEEVWRELSRELGVSDRDPSVFRRNILTRGIDLNRLIGREFTVQGVFFYGVTECRPCHWMNSAFAPGAEERLRGRGGLRAKILTDGVLRVDAREAADERAARPYRESAW